MDKQKLRKMPTYPAPSWMTTRAASAKLRRNDTIELWYADVQQVDEVTVLRVYERSKLLGGIADKENYRIYLDAAKKEYLSQRMDLKPPKCWRTGRIDSVFAASDIWCWPSFGFEPGYVENGYSPYITFDKAGEDTLEKALGPLEEKETWGLRIYRWQDKILKEKLVRRHEKELEPTVERMSHVPDLPDNFFDWLGTEAAARFDYVIYTPPKGKKTTDIQCTRCGAKMHVDVKKVRPVKDKRGTCPACGRPITWKTVTSKFNRTVSYWGYDYPWCAAIIQRMQKGLVVRYFELDVKFIMEYGDFKGREYAYAEVARDVYPDIHSTNHFCYEFIRYKNQGELRWAPALFNREYSTEQAFLYTDNLKDVLAGTAWQYSGLKEYQEKKWPYRIYLSAYMNSYPSKPYMEYLVKMGLITLAEQQTSYWYGNLEDELKKADRPDQLLGIPKQDIKTLIRYDGGLTMLYLMRALNRRHIRMSDEELLHYKSLFGDGVSELEPIYVGNMALDIHKRMKYFRKQAEKHFDKGKWNRKYTKADALLVFEKNLWSDWSDYIGWLRRFTPECMTDPYYVLPPDLPKAHDRLMKISLEQKEKEAAERKRKQEEEVNRILSEMQETGGIGMQARGLLIRLPRNAEEIRQEGKIMHHCVATYIDRVERHETLILFVRKVEEPEKPFYTLEWKDGKVNQCRGSRNADMTPEVKSFVGAFERAMQKKSREAERQKVKVTA